MFSPAGDFQASKIWRKIKKNPTTAKECEDQMEWLLFAVILVNVKDQDIILTENHLQQEIIPDSFVQRPWW